MKIAKFTTKIPKSRIVAYKDHSQKIENLKPKIGVACKKSRNLYYEIKNAVTEKLNKKQTDFLQKRNSLNNLHASGTKHSGIEYTTFSSCSSRVKLGDNIMGNKSSRIYDINVKLANAN